MIRFYLILAFFFALLWAAYWYWKRRNEAQLREASDLDYDSFVKNEPEFVAHLDRDGFYRVFHRTHFPRYPKYWLYVLGAFLVSLPATFASLSAFLWVGLQLGFIPKAADFADRYLIDSQDNVRVVSNAPPETAVYYAQDLAGFYFFFGLIAVWLIIVTVFLRHYHKNRPGYLRDEIIRSK